jgi:hypothetical protein
MSTRSSISIAYKNGTVKSIYCHSDGYLSYNGVLLLKHYSQNFSKLETLIGLGDLSSLDQNPETSFAYGRDRGETGTECNEHPNYQDFLESGNFQEYDYVYKEKTSTWYLLRNGKFKNLFSLVKKDKEISSNDIQTIQAIIEKQKLNKLLNKKIPINNLDEVKNKL